MYNNPYFNQQKFQNGTYNMAQMPIQQPIQPQQFIQPMQTLNNQIGLLGKIVESIDVVKAMDIPLDGSISYFPLTDGSAIVSKQLQNDGTSKTIIYKPTESTEKETKNFLTFDALEDALSDIQDLQDMKDDIKEIKKQLKEMKTKKGKDD